jgi:uncharacterized protein YjlB
VHYHSRIHEVLGIARGRGKVQFGGLKGRTLALKAGDVAILPAGTAINACPQVTTSWSLAPIRRPARMTKCTRSQDHKAALKTIPKVPRPRKDPLYGGDGPLLKLWRAAR